MCSPSPSSHSPGCPLSVPRDCLSLLDGRCTGLHQPLPWASPTALARPPSCACLEEQSERAAGPSPAAGGAAARSPRPLPKKGSWPSRLRRLSTTGWPKVMFGTKCLGAEERDAPAHRLPRAGRERRAAPPAPRAPGPARPGRSRPSPALPVHYIQVQVVGPAVQHATALGAQRRQVAVEDGGTDPTPRRHRCGRGCCRDGGRAGRAGLGRGGAAAAAILGPLLRPGSQTGGNNNNSSNNPCVVGSKFPARCILSPQAQVQPHARATALCRSSPRQARSRGKTLTSAVGIPGLNRALKPFRAPETDRVTQQAQTQNSVLCRRSFIFNPRDNICIKC